MLKKLFAQTAMAGALAMLPAAAGAIPLLDGFGGVAGYGDLIMNPNDDDSSARFNLPFSLDFFGTLYDSAWLNNNGNLSFAGPLSSYTPRPFPSSAGPMIAPYWGDVDTRGIGSVYLASPNASTLVATWKDVGYFGSHTDKTNSFQLILTDRADTGAGNFDFSFRYEQLQWTTGDASSGVGGLGGTPAQAGYDAGNGVDYFALPGSFTSSILNLANTSNVTGDTPGLWNFTVRNGALADGSTPGAPLMPEIFVDNGWQFSFPAAPDVPVFIDPAIAIGYDYVVQTGPNISEAWFADIGNSVDYSLFGWDGLDYTVFLGSIGAEQWFNFGAGGVDRFAIRGIDSGIGLDPDDPTAFVTGLKFAEGFSNVTVTMTPLIVNDDVPAVPEPASWAMLILGFGLVGGMARRRKTVLAA